MAEKSLALSITARMSCESKQDVSGKALESHPVYVRCRFLCVPSNPVPGAGAGAGVSAALSHPFIFVFLSPAEFSHFSRLPRL